MIRFAAAAVAAGLVAAAAPAQDWAKARLEKSPRHLEYVKLKVGNREVTNLVAYPEVKDKAPAVVVIHEIFGLADWPKLVCDQLAEKGFIAVAPDFLSGAGPDGGGTDKLPRDGVMKAIRDLPPDQITADLNAAVEYAGKLPACNGKVGVAGFCWGGGQALRFATNNKDIKAAFVFYGAAPLSEDDVKRVACPVYGFYGENDARINTTIEKTKEQMKAAGKTYEPVIYPGAGHGFLRAGDAPDSDPGNKKSADDYAANKKAKEEAWARWVGLLKKM
ncbi:MAG: dienelactone hydrolase family protein [Gemmataceae bacterium]|nr:dienelactone hydrolase family protein [Gemmataceae bacterium]